MLTHLNLFGTKKLGNCIHCTFIFLWSYLRGLVWFYGMSTIVGYAMPNPVYTYILDIYDLETQVKKVKWFQVLLCITNNSIKHQSFIYSQLNDETVLFLTIQFSISHFFALSLFVKQFYLTYRYDPIRCHHSEWSWEWWQWKGTPHSPKLQHYWSLTIGLINVISSTLIEGEFYPSAEMQLVYSTVLISWVVSYEFLPTAIWYQVFLSNTIFWLTFYYIRIFFKNVYLTQ